MADYSRQYLKFHKNTPEYYEQVAEMATVDLLPLLPAHKDLPIFEFGCGMGFSINGLNRIGYSNVIGIDADKGQIAAAKERGLNARLVSIPDTLPFMRDNRENFELIYALDVLEHVPKEAIVDVISALKDMLSPSGRFICRVPNCNSLVSMRMRYGDWEHCDSFSPESLDYVLYCGGFRDIRVIPAAELPVRSIKGAVRRMARSALRAGLRTVYLAEGIHNSERLPLTPNIVAVASNLV